MFRMPVCHALVALLLGVIALTGCGDGVSRSAVKVTVTTSKAKLDDTDSITVVFVAEGSGGENALANGNPNKQPLTAKPQAGEGTGVKPGKYKLTVQLTPYAGMGTPEHHQQLQQISSQYDPTNSKLTYEVVAGKEQTITIDLDAGTVTGG
jgi:hypothetical protein